MQSLDPCFLFWDGCCLGQWVKSLVIFRIINCCALASFWIILPTFRFINLQASYLYLMLGVWSIKPISIQISCLIMTSKPCLALDTSFPCPEAAFSSCVQNVLYCAHVIWIENYDELCDDSINFFQVSNLFLAKLVAWPQMVLFITPWTEQKHCCNFFILHKYKS